MEKNDLNARLEALRREEERKSREFRLHHQRRMEEVRIRKAEAKRLLTGKVRRADVVDYTMWLEGFMRNGGTPTHCYQYPMGQVLDGWFVAFADFELVPLFGASSINIIVAKGVHFKGEELGHNNLYFMDGFTVKGGWIPVYSDIKF